jgi:hypothetical protein
MDITLEQCLASAVRYIQNHVSIEAAPYFDEVPEDYVVPSMYFPVPRTSSKKVTFRTYLTTVYMEVQFLAATDWMAYSYAGNIRDSIMLDDEAMDIMEKDGTLSGKKIRVGNVTVYPPVETGIVKLSFELKNYFSKDSGEAVKANEVVISGLIKPDALYTAWYAATEEQRKEEEAQKECLQKALESL